MAEIRIIAGVYGGRRIKTLEGSATRPTTDRIREAWASSVASMLTDGFEGVCALDTFAGSGALGLEAISRGAQNVVFCDKNRSALNVIQANVIRLVADDNSYRIVNIDVFSKQFTSKLNKLNAFDLLILDPPYAIAHETVLGLIDVMIAAGMLAESCVISYEHSKYSEIQQRKSHLSIEEHKYLELLSSKIYGSTQIDYMVYHGA